ncbi:MAG: hypothetical protein COA79_18230 [Planctomycetota bacterium]|nr:MAG: hypothetical protein COA79_18230 [Planctomycetota bacterium]
MNELWASTVFLRTFLILLGMILVISYYSMKLWVDLLPFTFFRILITPGIAIHEYSHAIACLLTGAPVSSITIFDKDGGSVVHGNPKIKIIGPVIIAMAPIAGALLIFSLMGFLLNYPFNIKVNSFESFFKSLGNVPWTKWQVYLYLYACINLMMTIAPSKQDLKNCQWGLIGTFIIICLLEYTKILNGQALANKSIEFYVPFLIISMLCLLITVPFCLIKKSK